MVVILVGRTGLESVMFHTTQDQSQSSNQLNHQLSQHSGEVRVQYRVAQMDRVFLNSYQLVNVEDIGSKKLKSIQLQ